MNRITTSGKLRKGLSLVLAGAFMASMLAGCGSSGTSGTAASASSASGAAATSAPAATQAAPTADSSRKTAQSSGERYKKITIGIPSDPADLGPTGYGDNSAQYTMPNYFEALFDFRDNDYVPILAKGYTVKDDTHWDVQLYDYIKDSDGNPITADDVVFSYKTLIDSGKAARWDTFGDIKAIDDYTVEFTWTKKIDLCSNRKESLGELNPKNGHSAAAKEKCVGIDKWLYSYRSSKALAAPGKEGKDLSQKAYEAGNMASSPVGTGPYKVTEYDPGAKIVMEANDNYWQKDDLRDAQHLANVQTIEYDIISETSQHVIALSTNQIQYSESVPAENLKDFQEGGQYAEGHAVFATQGSAVEMLLPNCMDGKATSDINLRYAIFYALDNTAIATAVGTYSPSKAFGTPFFSDYDTAWESQNNNYMATYDLDKAKDYLSKSSYKGQELVILCGSDEASKTACTMIQTMLLQIGINVKINAEDGNLVDTDMRNSDNWDLLYKDAGGGSQVGEWNRPMNYDEFGTGYNMAMIKDDTLQNDLKTASTIDGHTKENMAALHQYILDNAY
jgi:ABC-type transport system substrate-binding protein